MNIAILGSTGSIGKQALDIVQRQSDRLRVLTLATGSNADLLAEQALEFRPTLVALADENGLPHLRDRLKDTGILVTGVDEGLHAAATYPGVQRILLGMTGFAALEPALAGAQAGKDLCLANKEALVAAGDLLVRAARDSGAQLLPVDSEHSAMFQCLLGEDPASVRRLILTASGGAFRDLPASDLEHVTPEQALDHPTWRMGAKITVDSATLMNKGLEIIEAHRLFDVDIDKIVTVQHAQSIVHSLVEFMDGSTKAQVGPPDMRVPIQYALLYPHRAEWEAPLLDWTRTDAWTFGPLDEARYPCLTLAREAAQAGGDAPAVLSAADEVAVQAFLDRKIGFLDIARVIEYTLEAHRPQPLDSVEGLLEADRWARRQASACSARIAGERTP
ncbi:MAG: 1-deoxy-D-xylulose-5-phosphate reductoisomerase [Armatimonadetes bacterium]|nr:1-deoxy-D-xylulose-5-phosphate reductoisomerase [Armatimonadota bacterium]